VGEFDVMLQDAARSRSIAGDLLPGLHYPLIRHVADGGALAWQANRPVSRAQFLADVAALAACLPAEEYVVNLCTDRYRFTVGLAAALCRRQISLMPSNDAPATLKALASDYRGVYALIDKGQPPLPAMMYPETLHASGSAGDVPLIPAAQPAVILFTSGSTGKPKPVPKSWGVLVQSALSAGARLGLSAFRGGAIVGTVPHQHSYGFESLILLALQYDVGIVGERPFYPADIEAVIASVPRPRIFVTTPVHLRSLVALPSMMPKVDLIVSATAPLSVELAAQAERCLGAPLIEIYGCTEAGQIATRRTLRETTWRCLDGVAILERGPGSWIAGSAVPCATQLQDLIERVGSDTFVLSGRSAELVDVAGKHTTLAHLNDQLLTVEGVTDGIFLIPEADGGSVNRLAAVVVAPGLEADAILRALRERIDAAFLPRPLILVDSLPRNSVGKVPREALLQLLHRSRRS
jgi:acyl-coenzyme A synthetase/AMP-(fatty) acid ligase